MKYFGIVSFLIISNLSLFAQSGLGVKGGILFDQLKIDQGNFGKNVIESYNSKTGTVWGIWGRLEKNKFFFQPEAVVVLSSGQLKIDNSVGLSPEIVNVKYSDYQMPILFGYKPISSLRLMAGPMFSINISESKNLRDAFEKYTSGNGDVLADVTYNYQLGASFKVLGLEIDLRRQGGLSNIINKSWAQPDNLNLKKNTWILSLAFKIL